jgi:hypothetical protein
LPFVFPFILLFIIYPSATACAIAKFVDEYATEVPVELTKETSCKTFEFVSILYYQCASHAYLGNRIDTNSKVLQDVSFVSSTGTSVAYSSTNFAIAQAVALG